LTRCWTTPPRWCTRHAEALASAAAPPRHLIIGLVALGGEAAALVLGRTRLIFEDELVDAAAIGSERAQIAIAQRENLAGDRRSGARRVGGLVPCLR